MTASNAKAQQKPAAPPKSEATPLKAKPKAAVLITVLVTAAAAGVGGGFALAPRLTPHGMATADSAEAEREHWTEEQGRGEKRTGRRIFKIDNLIVNPAGSEGSRFLMTSVAFEVETEAAEAALRNHEVQVRDLVVSRLENQTMRMLTMPFARDSLKRQLAAAIVAVVGPKARVTVYLPQFVIQ